VEEVVGTLLNSPPPSSVPPPPPICAGTTFATSYLAGKKDKKMFKKNKK
jgi:hypothetical protein